MRLTGTLDHTGTLLRDAADLATDLGAKRAAIIVDLAGDAAVRASHAAHTIPETADAVRSRASAAAHAIPVTVSAVRSRASDLSARDVVIAAVGAAVVLALVVALVRRLRSRDDDTEPTLETT